MRAHSVHALLRSSQEDTQRRERQDTGEVETTELKEDLTVQAAPGDSGRDTESISSEAAELLSEKVRWLMKKPETLRR